MKTTTVAPEFTQDDDEEGEEKESVDDILAQIKAAGGIDAFEENRRKEEEAKKAKIEKEKQRRLEISQKTRNRLTRLLDRKRAEAAPGLERVPTKESVEVIGEVPGIAEDETPAPVTLRPNRFRPKAGTREQLRSILHVTLEDSSVAVESNENDRKPFVQRQRVPPPTPEPTTTTEKIGKRSFRGRESLLRPQSPRPRLK